MKLVDDQLLQKSKLLAFILRHRPEIAKLTLDKEGWANVETLLKNSSIDEHDLKQIVASDNKKRYSFSPDGLSIRANQGHSTSQVSMTFKKAVPPAVLYHGTTAAAMVGISKRGIIPVNRQYVHLSEDPEVAQSVGGRRRGETVVLTINCKKMLADEVEFFLSENNVWLVKSVEQKYIIQ